ncbi:hypothetical protein SVIOM74S_08002 [Streptomyces violarus]
MSPWRIPPPPVDWSPVGVTRFPPRRPAVAALGSATYCVRSAGPSAVVRWCAGRSPCFRCSPRCSPTGRRRVFRRRWGRCSPGSTTARAVVAPPCRGWGSPRSRARPVCWSARCFLAVGSAGGRDVRAAGAARCAGALAGALSSTGPVASACGTQVLVAAVIGAGMPLPESGGERALLFLAGAGWALFLLLVLPSQRRSSGGPYRYDRRARGGRRGVRGGGGAAARGGQPRAPARRAALTAALDQAQDAAGRPSVAALRELSGGAAAARPVRGGAAAGRGGDGAGLGGRAPAWPGRGGAAAPGARGAYGERLRAAARAGAVGCGPPRAGRRPVGGRGGVRPPGRGSRCGPCVGGPGSLVPLVRRAFGPAGREYGFRGGAVQRDQCGGCAHRPGP